VHANNWHFLHAARPPYTPEEIDRYIEAWSQPGAVSCHKGIVVKQRGPVHPKMGVTLEVSSEVDCPSFGGEAATAF